MKQRISNQGISSVSFIEKLAEEELKREATEAVNLHYFNKDIFKSVEEAYKELKNAKTHDEFNDSLEELSKNLKTYLDSRSNT
jgi:hypothetical protein